jgi:hypothetical protein
VKVCLNKKAPLKGTGLSILALLNNAGLYQ